MKKTVLVLALVLGGCDLYGPPIFSLENPAPVKLSIAKVQKAAFEVCKFKPPRALVQKSIAVNKSSYRSEAQVAGDICQIKRIIDGSL